MGTDQERQYYSAFTIAEDYAPQENVEKLTRYKNLLESKDYGGEVGKLTFPSLDFVKVCILFAGALYDESNYSDQRMIEAYKQKREFYQKYLNMGYIKNWCVIRQILEDLGNCLIKNDKGNADHYKGAYYNAKVALNKLYSAANGGK